jgi:hypothetical protein
VFCHGCDHGEHCEMKQVHIYAVGFFGQLDNKGSKGTDIRPKVRTAHHFLAQSAQKSYKFHASAETIVNSHIFCILYSGVICLLVRKTCVCTTNWDSRGARLHKNWNVPDFIKIGMQHNR